MHFAIIQDTDRSENPPDAFWGATKEEVAQKVCSFMHTAYSMPVHIVTIDDASAWFGGHVEDGEEAHEDADIDYNAVWHWDTDKETC